MAKHADVSGWQVTQKSDDPAAELRVLVTIGRDGLRCRSGSDNQHI